MLFDKFLNYSEIVESAVFTWTPCQGATRIFYYEDGSAIIDRQSWCVPPKYFETAAEAVAEYFGRITAPALEDRPAVKVGHWRPFKRSTRNDAISEKIKDGLDAEAAFLFFEEVGLV